MGWLVGDLRVLLIFGNLQLDLPVPRYMYVGIIVVQALPKISLHYILQANIC